MQCLQQSGYGVSKDCKSVIYFSRFFFCFAIAICSLSLMKFCILRIPCLKQDSQGRTAQKYDCNRVTKKRKEV